MGKGVPIWLRFIVWISLFLLAGSALLIEFNKGLEFLSIHPENRRMLQIFAVLNLVTIALIRYSPVSRSRGLLPLILLLPAGWLSIIDFTLAGFLVFDFRVDRLWVLGLLLPAFSLGALSFLELADEPDSDAEGIPGRARAPVPEADDKGKGPILTPKRILWGETVSLFWTAFTVVVVLAALAVGTVAFVLLKGVLFDGRILPLHTLGWLFEGERWLETGLYISLVPIVIIIVYGAVALGRALFLRLGVRNWSRYCRQLSRHELDFLDNATRLMIEYSQMRKYPWFWGIFFFGSFISLLLLLMAGVFMGLATALTTVRDIIVLRDLGPLLVPTDPLGVSVLLGVAGSFILVWPALQWLYRLSPRWVEYVYMREGWNTFSPQPRSEAQFYAELDMDLRNDRIEAGSKFDAAQFVQQAYRRADRPAWLTTCAVTSVIAVFFAFDVQSYMVFTRDEMVRSGFFSSEQVRYRYEEALQVRTGCYVATRDDQPALILRYRITAPDGVTYNLDGLLRTQTLSDIERIDGILRRAGTPHQPVEPAGVRNRGKLGLDPKCISDLEGIYGADAQRMRTVLRLPSDLED